MMMGAKVRSTEPSRGEEDTSGYVVEWQLLHGGNEGDEAPDEPADDPSDLWRDTGVLPGLAN
jgi:hypothetical protein